MRSAHWFWIAWVCAVANTFGMYAGWQLRTPFIAFSIAGLVLSTLGMLRFHAEACLQERRPPAPKEDPHP